MYKKNILFLSSYFSINKSPAGPRSNSFYRYCKDYFNPIILTSPTECPKPLHNVFTAESCHDQPRLSKSSLVNNPQLGYFLNKINHIKDHCFKNPTDINHYLTIDSSVPANLEWAYSQLFETIVPTADLYWIKNGLKKAEGIFSKIPIDAIYTSFPQLASLELGYQLSKKYNIPLITEFRDGLAFEPLISHNSINNTIYGVLEEKYCNHSTALISIGNQLTTYFNTTYSRTPCYTIFNGYDPEFFPKTRKKINSQHINFASFGSFSKSKTSIDVTPMIEAIKSICQKYSQQVSFYFIGNLSDHEVRLIETIKSETNATVAISPRVDKAEGLKFLSNNIDYLLFLGVKNETTIVSSKLFDYLNLQIPIIGICKGNEAETLINDTQTGEVCDFNKEDIENIIEKAVKKELKFSPQKEKISFFTRENQAILLGNLMKKILT